VVLQKSDKGMHCLQAARTGELTLRDRHVLILADGRRAAREIVDALGGDAATRIERLLASGHLEQTREARTSARRIDADAPPAADMPMPRTAPNRSLAAARLYLLDMLRLQRGREADELARAIQRTTDPIYQVPVLLDALRYLLAVARPSYGQRVGAQVLALVPEDCVASVREVLEDWPTPLTA
jgi:hypothetical protein